ncbi:type II secretion system protein GspG [Pseudoalteromonas luteoviolacea]|uniref:Type II secretion system protein GspG C-terminal domain-containing protein n=1 Tax=Pseudoalteromonas luteoviolacea H33 TaxID=1365251 RepID=A0A167AGV2_9GAMM|nr:type II secretion system protein GspG [Pseudoalteromonas luteoviolacea]KZN45371.1 hypothetical protein N476_04975 [Pseudoalteromonas luteoviolacea H33]KZN70765.1 hypothetical protein N477_05065 [Pseudoalteromonas luteoviolacea H33-S]
MSKPIVALLILVPLLLLVLIYQPTIHCFPLSPERAAKLDIQHLGTAAALYSSLLKHDISQIKELHALEQTAPKLIDNVPLDPWDKPYHFRFLGGQAEAFVIWSTGSLDSEAGLIMFTFTKVNGDYKAALLQIAEQHTLLNAL